MKFFIHKKEKLFHKKRRFNPHHIWNVFFASFVILAIAILCFFSWYFMYITQKLDQPIVAPIETNAAKIKIIEKTLNETEAAVQSRTGTLPGGQ